MVDKNVHKIRKNCSWQNSGQKCALNSSEHRSIKQFCSPVHDQKMQILVQVRKKMKRAGF